MKKILIVDDSDTVRNQVKKSLEDAGYAVVEAFDGVNGVQQAMANKDIACVISDVNMPNMDGFSMCAKLREISQLKNIPIFMLATETNDEMKKKGKSVGVVAWMAKPYNAQKMILAIKKTIG